MKIRRIDIKNFRGIRDLSLSLGDVTVLIGDNNSGKTTILDALRISLSRAVTRRTGAFGDYDYHLPNGESQPVDADPIEITLLFEEDAVDEWPDEVLQTVPEAIQVRSDDRQCLIFRVTSRYDELTSSFSTSWDFLDPAGNTLTKAANPRNLNGLQRLIPTFYLAALRDAAQEFRPRSPFWGPFVRAVKIPPDQRKQIEDDLAALNQRVLNAHESFNPVRERLRNASRLVPLGADDPVGIEAIPGKVFDLLSRTQVMLSGRTGARLPIGHHGEGTQSLAVICLFDAFLEAQLGGAYTEHASPILALEEPEAHLHPAAIRSIGKLLCDLRGQKIIASHSGDLVASVPIASLRRLCRRGDVIRVFQVRPGRLTPEEQRKLDHHIRFSRGSLLFARFWLLVEGETDALIFQECARILGHDLFSEGVCCVEYATIGVEKFIKLADELGIDWLVTADRDPAGHTYLNTVQSLLAGRPEAQHARQLPAAVIETFLCLEGHGDVYEQRVSPQKAATVIAPRGSEEYWNQVVKAQPDRRKPEAAAVVVDRIEAAGSQAVPAFIREVVETSISRARAAA